ncbi:hypothetical protein KJ656_03495 [bacterium]|nr:hypothetical protein [bacterium]
MLETEAQVKDCLSWLDDIDGERKIIALTPFAMHELDKQKVHYKIIEEYYSSEELYKLGINNFKIVEEVCRTIDNSILKTNEKLKEFHITPALFNFYCLKIIYDAITIRLFQLNKLIKCEKPDAIIVYEGKKNPFGTMKNAPYLFFDKKESLYSQLLFLHGWETRIIKKSYIQEYSDDDEGNKETFLINITGIFKKWIISNPLINDFAVILKKNGISSGYNYLKNIIFCDKKTPVIIFGPGYNWDDCLDELQNEGLIPRYRISEDFHWLYKSLKSKVLPMKIVWSDLKNNREFNKFFEYDNLNFLPVLESRLQYITEEITSVCILSYDYFARLIADKKIRAVISSTISTPEGHTIAQAAHNAGIPVITWQHGGYGEMDHPILYYTELISSDAHFIFGDGVRKYLEQPAKILGTRLITIGSTSLGKIRNDPVEYEQKSKKVILYITSAILQNYSNISTFPPFEDNRFWKTQKEIINVLGKYKDYDIIVKLHPTNVVRDTPIRSYVAGKGFNNFSFIKQERSIIDLISVADAIIIDFPFTTLLQALTIIKPLFVYLGHIQWDENASYLLGKRAICNNDLTCFKELLDKYLCSGIYDANVNNKEFLINYGTSSLEGSPGMRAARALKQVINEFKFNHSSKHRRV